jgi:hypothetical protein
VIPDFSNEPLGAETFCCPPMVRFPMGGASELVYFPLHQVAHSLGVPDVKLLGSCPQFATLPMHADRLLDGLPTPDGDVLRRLTALAKAGLMLSRSELLRRVRTFSDTGTPARLSWLAIPTSNRPEELLRALESYALHFTRFGRSLKVLIADDSEQSQLVRESLRSRFAGSGQTLFYLGPEEKRQFVALLTRDRSLPREVVEFGIFGPAGHTPTMGANRNAILLQTAGEMVLSVDDDTICQPRIPSNVDGTGTLRLGSEGDPTEFWFFPDRESALASTRPAEIDITDSHEKLLGRRVWNLVQPVTGDGVADLSSACHHLLEGIWFGKGQVSITLNGSVGDSGMYSGRNLPVHRDPATRRRLVDTAEAYETALRSREVLRQARSATVCHSSPFMSMFVGFDNRGLLPPFFPAYRNEDGAFGHTVARCVDSCYFGYLPWALVHDPPSDRSYYREGATTVRMSDCLLGCVMTWTCTNRRASTEDRLQSLGRLLIEMGSVDPGGFDEMLRTSLWKRASQRVAQKELLLRQFGGYPAYWAADLKREIEGVQRAVVRPDYTLPIDLPQNLSKPECMQQAQDLIRRYGELLVWWPAIVERAKALAATSQLPTLRIA